MEIKLNLKDQGGNNSPKINIQKSIDNFSMELARITNEVLLSGAPVVTIVSIIEMTKIQIAVDHINERRHNALIQQAAEMAEKSTPKIKQ